MFLDCGNSNRRGKNMQTSHTDAQPGYDVGTFLLWPHTLWFSCFLAGERCGHGRPQPGGAGSHAAQHQAGRECECGGGSAGGHLPASGAGKRVWTHTHTQKRNHSIHVLPLLSFGLSVIFFLFFLLLLSIIHLPPRWSSSPHFLQFFPLSLSFPP